jgi:outer membrane receptor protein involved in Fe transport
VIPATADEPSSRLARDPPPRAADRARLENSYTGPRYSIFFSNPYEFVGTYRQLPGYDLINIRAGVRLLEHWSATAFVNNLTNKHVQLESMFTENEPQPSFTRIETNQPLTAGVDLTYRF